MAPHTWRSAFSSERRYSRAGSFPPSVLKKRTPGTSHVYNTSAILATARFRAVDWFPGFSERPRHLWPGSHLGRSQGDVSANHEFEHMTERRSRPEREARVDSRSLRWIAECSLCRRRGHRPGMPAPQKPEFSWPMTHPLWRRLTGTLGHAVDLDAFLNISFWQ